VITFLALAHPSYPFSGVHKLFPLYNGSLEDPEMKRRYFRCFSQQGRDVTECCTDRRCMLNRKYRLPVMSAQRNFDCLMFRACRFWCKGNDKAVVENFDWSFCGQQMRTTILWLVSITVTINA